MTLRNKVQGGILATLLAIVAIGAWWWIPQKDKPTTTAQLIALTGAQRLQVKWTLLKEEGDTRDPQLLKMIGHDIRNAQICWDCRQFQEWSHGSVYMTYPIVGHKAHEAGATYTLVIGLVGWHAGGPNSMKVLPVTAIYVEKGNRVFRITDRDEMTYTEKGEGWMWSRVNYLSVEYKMKREAMHALQDPIVQKF